MMKFPIYLIEYICRRHERNPAYETSWYWRNHLCCAADSRFSRSTLLYAMWNGRTRFDLSNEDHLLEKIKLLSCEDDTARVTMVAWEPTSYLYIRRKVHSSSTVFRQYWKVHRFEYKNSYASDVVIFFSEALLNFWFDHAHSSILYYTTLHFRKFIKKKRNFNTERAVFFSIQTWLQPN